MAVAAGNEVNVLPCIWILHKVDLLGQVDFDLARFRANIAHVNPGLPVVGDF